MRAMQSTPYCLANWTMVNVQLVVQRYATKIRIDALWGVVMSWKTGDQEWTTEGNGGNSPSRQLGIIFISTALFCSSWSSFIKVALPLSRQFGITIIEHRHTGLLYGVFHQSGGRKWLILLSKPVFWMMVFPSHRLFMVMKRNLKVSVHSSVRLSVTILTSLQVLSYQLKWI